jgi:hypothetical protein
MLVRPRVAAECLSFVSMASPWHFVHSFRATSFQAPAGGVSRTGSSTEPVRASLSTSAMPFRTPTPLACRTRLRIFEQANDFRFRQAPRFCEGPYIRGRTLCRNIALIEVAGIRPWDRFPAYMSDAAAQPESRRRSRSSHSRLPCRVQLREPHSRARCSPHRCQGQRRPIRSKTTTIKRTSPRPPLG